MQDTNTFVLTFNKQTVRKVVKVGIFQVKVEIYIPNPFDAISVRNTAITRTDVQESRYVADAEITLIRKLIVEQLRIVSTVAKNIMPILRIVTHGNRRRKFRG